ncbi:TolC family protein [Marivirga sp. S37H4]|uniref:TolC family protein n=1 Tax=Marivirga aurantiaca TaxID=2802615 RepID=A0A934X193_9BACT|nr:TolC family protein [Marivirga aurantiaca]MBK6266602.1 TolC family protein [Marivirga aurantiaca]
MKYKITFIAALFVSLIGVQIQAQEILTFEDVVEIGLQNNFDIKISENNREIANNNYSVGNAGFLPTLDIQAVYAGDNNLRFQGTSASDSVFVVRDVRSNNYGASATLNWVFFDGARMFVTYDKLNDIREQAQWDAKGIVENTLSNILIAYYTIINEKSRFDILENTLALSRERLQIAEEKYKLGNFSKSEYLSAQVDFNADQSAYISQKGALSDAKVQLNVLLARDAEQVFTVADSIITIDGFFEIEKLRNKLREENYNLISSRIGLKIAEKEKNEIRTELLPQLAFSATSGLGRSNNPIGFLRATESTYLNYGFTASWRIFDGFNRNRRVENAIITRDNQQVSLDQLKNELLGQLETQYVLYQNRLELIRLEVKNVEVAKDNAEIALESFKVGRSNSLAFREAQLNAVQAAGRLLNALFEAKLAEIEILRITGTTITEY